jgi:hypothetical protein
MQVIDQAMFTLAGMNLPENLTTDEWKHIHRDILICKRAASKWLQQSRDYSNERWGMEFTADTEAQLELKLGLVFPEPKPALNPADKTKAIVTIEGLSQSFILWQRKMSDEIPQWDKDRLNRALELLEPMEREAKRVRELLNK